MSKLRPVLRAFGVATVATAIVAVVAPMVYGQLLGINAPYCLFCGQWQPPPGCGIQSGLFATGPVALVWTYLTSERVGFPLLRANYQLRLWPCFSGIGANSELAGRFVVRCAAAPSMRDRGNSSEKLLIAAEPR